MSRYHSREYDGYKIILSDSWMDAVKGLLTPEEAKEFRQMYRYSPTTGEGKTKFDISNLSDASLKRLIDFLTDHAEVNSDRSARMSANLVKQWIDIKGSPDGALVSKLENVPSAIKTYMEKVASHRWVFQVAGDGNTLPWLLDSAHYNPPTEDSPATVGIHMLARNGVREDSSERSHGESSASRSSVFLSSGSFKGSNVGEIFRQVGLYVETEERVASYNKELNRFNEHCAEDGFQMNVSGKAYLLGGWCSSGFRPVEKSGRPSKMVVDPPDYDKDSAAAHCPFWSKEEDKVWDVPMHPLFSMFDLSGHERYRVHVNNTEPYVYDTAVGDKLILPQNIKDFVEVLVEHSRNKFVDIVDGKEGGTIILFEGPPGTGKTLSAEVYSEVMKRPLYKVQSSQLGTAPDTVEKQLGEVLGRAERWGAILLIDEADVYVHERGTDLKQNAIVGVFLRVLEYYRGVLFMTTNRGTLIDDAIISRLTARFAYTTPDEDSRRQLWKVLAAQNDIQIFDDDVEKLVDKLDTVSGRDIKNLLKMAYVMAAKKLSKVVTYELVMFVSQFQAKV